MIRAPVTGKVEFFIESAYKTQIYFDDSFLKQNKGSSDFELKNSTTNNNFSRELVEGRYYYVKLTLNDANGLSNLGDKISLSWSYSGQSKT